ncbi:WXG100 family type VII secretion target [Streptomyces fimicarius]|uniref:ESAT-6-like protein n=2 Tax=Streptomyces TaxID=1883 RepID=A0AB33KF13_9ACTN|nr:MULTISPECIES: WXG100 family type VII secretion target [Streptomyces]MCL6291396.1 WXG100 family type VII secretion target [Streptomyces sp. 43Y-GA-1]MCX4710667.1 WXG100 family type VII secretion target [Streptomyces griseus]MDX2669894.1 WXG100 family type VII secretion target [Streptomyces sp. NRRL_ISP-5395]MDX3336793.1 WXG100 family type VII secretion target [Streptomyces sp. ME02-6979.5a]MDX3500994.1 WXG100 family type VII secretion target [Streptomyces sp. ATCC51928]
MTDDHIGVSFSTLRDLAGELEDILKQLNEKLETLYGRTEKAVLTWEGEARDTFVDELDKWDREMQDLQAAQAWLHDVVTTGHSNYAAAHQAVLRGWGAA